MQVLYARKPSLMNNNLSKNKCGLVIHLDLSRDRDDMFGCYDSALYNTEGGSPLAQAGGKKGFSNMSLKRDGQMC